MNLLMLRVADESRKTMYAIILSVWAMVAVYAIAHDQYIVRIAPEHFTEYHKPLLGIRNPTYLAAAYAFGASIPPGLLLGIACAFLGRARLFSSHLNPVSIKFILIGCFAVILATEITAATSGYWVYKTEQTLYFSDWYPDKSLPMLITQTIQLTCYFSSAAFSTVFLIFIATRKNGGPNRV